MEVFRNPDVNFAYLLQWFRETIHDRSKGRATSLDINIPHVIVTGETGFGSSVEVIPKRRNWSSKKVSRELLEIGHANPSSFFNLHKRSRNIWQIFFQKLFLNEITNPSFTNVQTDRHCMNSKFRKTFENFGKTVLIGKLFQLPSLAHLRKLDCIDRIGDGVAQTFDLHIDSGPRCQWRGDSIVAGLAGLEVFVGEVATGRRQDSVYWFHRLSLLVQQLIHFDLDLGLGQQEQGLDRLAGSMPLAVLRSQSRVVVGREQGALLVGQELAGLLAEHPGRQLASLSQHHRFLLPVLLVAL